MIIKHMDDLTPQEKQVIQTMRAVGPYADFRIEKRPLKEDRTRGELVRIIVEKSSLLTPA